ncbi:MAG: TRAP transporter large permease subunit [Clostridium fessum]
MCDSVFRHILNDRGNQHVFRHQQVSAACHSVFVLSGNIMAKAGISKRLIRFVNTCVGHRRGGIAIVCVIVACFFGAISGSGPATVAALGAVLIPAMIEQGGFSAAFSTALMATSSSIAIVIPPSIAFVVYASITGVSIGDMFTGGHRSGYPDGSWPWSVVVMLEVRRKNMSCQSSVRSMPAKRALERIQGCVLGTVDARHHPGRHLRRHLYPDRGGSRIRCVRSVCRHRYLQGSKI